MYKRVIYNLNSNGILVNEQTGFRRDLSTNRATYRLNHGILQALRNKSDVAEIFHSLAKAFDCVNHSILLNL
jgi:hypothetical protein